MAESDRQRWNQKYKAREGIREPSEFLRESKSWIPPKGKALDWAGGSGRHALWLAEQGLIVTLADISEEALKIAAAEANLRGQSLQLLPIDLEQDPLVDAELLQTPWDLLLCFHYLWRPLFSQLEQRLAPGGLFLFCHPTKRNLEKNSKPSARFLLEEGEIESLLPPRMKRLRLEEKWHGNRHEVRLVARFEP